MRCTMPISRSVGNTMNTSQSAASTEAHTSGGSERRMSVAHNIREEQPAGHREDHVEGDQHGDRLARRPEAARQHRLRRLHGADRSEEHTSELQSLTNLVCRLLLEKKKKTQRQRSRYGY